MKKKYSQAASAFSGVAVVSALLLMLGGAASVFYDYTPIGWAEIIAGAAVLIIYLLLLHGRKEKIKGYLKTVSEEHGAITSNILDRLPVPMIVVNVDGTIRWYNERFAVLFDNADMFGSLIESVVSGIKWGEILKTASDIRREIVINGSSFTVVGSMVRDKESEENDEDKYLTYLYFIDNTEEKRLSALYEDERTAVAIITIDNYDEVLQRVNDSDQQQIVSQIRNLINLWAGEGDAIVKKTERDRYFMFFENKHLEKYIENKFNVLDKVREISESIKIPVSISIGIGIGGSIKENESNARSALEMTLGRGGDQVCIKDDTQYRFYGGKSKEYEKSTRVKTRVVAGALRDFIKNSDKVIFMGHSGADYDCFGAAMGLQRAVRTLGRKPYIIYDNNSPAVRGLYEDLRAVPEYKDMFVNKETIFEEITENTLLVVLDTHKPSMLPAPDLLKRISKVVLIDHHRRSTEFINPCSLIYHEPYASSACEMATELLEYMDLGGALTVTEAECLYMGILMDTKNFILKTGVRTFGAASYLKRLGLNTVEVKKRFNVNKADYDHKVDIVKTAVEIVPNIAVARCGEKYDNIRVIASQAADEMLNIGSICASFVVYAREGGVGVCARSLGDINVQLIMEALGGGGHMTVAGTQIKNRTVDEVINDVKTVVNEYIKQNTP